MKISNEIARELCWEGGAEGFEVLEEGEWTADGKYQYKQIVFKYDIDNKCYSIYVSRSGSPFTDYYYCWDDAGTIEAIEVKKVEKTIIVWEPVKD